MWNGPLGADGMRDDAEKRLEAFGAVFGPALGTHHAAERDRVIRERFGRRIHLGRRRAKARSELVGTTPIHAAMLSASTA